MTRPTCSPWAAHEWENRYESGLWTYSLDEVWSGLQAAYADLVADAQQRHGVAPETFGAIGVSAMMHGYLAFDEAGDAARAVPHLAQHDHRPRGGGAHRRVRREHPAALVDRAPASGGPGCRAARSRHPLRHDPRRLRPPAPDGGEVLGVGDASGMFPIDSATADYDAAMLARYDELAAGRLPVAHVAELLPRVLVAGAPAGALTAEGAALLDPSGTLRPGIPFCPPEGDAGTGMVATNAVAPRTGNVSAGTSIFAMVVLERPLERVHHELDLVTTPSGDAVAMVHCNNGASELAAWAGMFARFAAASGAPLDRRRRLRDAVPRGARGRGGCRRAARLQPPRRRADRRPRRGPPAVRAHARQPLHARQRMRAQLYGVFGTLALGMRVLEDEGRRPRPHVRPRRHVPHRRCRAALPRRRARRPRVGRRHRVGGRGVGHRRARRLPPGTPTI